MSLIHVFDIASVGLMKKRLLKIFFFIFSEKERGFFGKFFLSNERKKISHLCIKRLVICSFFYQFNSMTISNKQYKSFSKDVIRKLRLFKTGVSLSQYRKQFIISKESKIAPNKQIAQK